MKNKILILTIAMFLVMIHSALGDGVCPTDVNNYYSFDDGDDSETPDQEKTNNLTLVGGLKHYTSPDDSVLEFQVDSTTNWGQTNKSLDTCMVADNPRTIITWFYPTVLESMYIIGTGQTGVDTIFAAYLTNAGPGNLKLADGGSEAGTIAAALNSWQMLTQIYTSYEYGIQVLNKTQHVNVSRASLNTGSSVFVLGEDIGRAGAQTFEGNISDVKLYCRELTKHEIDDCYDLGHDFNLLPVSPPTEQIEFTVTATDQYDSVALNNISISISNSTSFSFNASTQNGTILLLNSSFKFNELYNITFSANESGGYFNNTFNNINITEEGSFAGTLFQSRILVNAQEVITNNTIISFTVSVPLQSNLSNSSGFAVLLLRSGDYNMSGDATGYMSRGGFNFSVDPKQEININISLGTANLTVTASSSGVSVNDFNSTMILLSTGSRQTIETNTGTVVFPTIVGTFNITLNSTDFTFGSQGITILSGNTLPNITFNLFSQNSINISIFDEETNQLIINLTTTLIMDHPDQKFTNTTGTGNVFFIDLFDDLWNLLVSTPFHAQREYIFTIVPQSTSTLNVYLFNSSNGELKTFTIKNKKDQTLPDTSVAVSNKINNTFVTVVESVSNFAGQVNLFLSSSNEYRFTVEADGFTTKVFDLVPVVDSYNIILDPVDAIDFTTVFNLVSYTILPADNILQPQQNQNISIITSSPDGFITYFGLNSSFNSTIERITNVSGSPAGGTATILINTSAHNSTTIPVDFFIKVAGRDIIEVHRDFRTSLFVEPGNASAVSRADKYKDQFTDVGKSLIIVVVAVAVILSLAEVGAPAIINGVAGAGIIIFGAIIGWISITVGIIVAFITMGMYLIRRGD